MESNITIYKENIKEYISVIKDSTKDGDKAIITLSDGKDLDITNLTEAQLTAAAFGEEIEHTTPSWCKHHACAMMETQKPLHL